MGTRMLVVALAWACGAACFHPTAAQDQPCSPDGFCPNGQRCDMTQLPPTCVVGDGGALGGDAGSIDAPIARDGMMVSCAGGCPAAEPICDTNNNTCRGCVADAECPAQACQESTGACVAAGSAVYVATSGQNGGTCTQGAPCATVTYALTQVSAGRSFIAVGPGKYADAFLMTSSVPTTISGPSQVASDAEIDYVATGSGIDHVIEITSTASELVEGLTIANDSQNEGIRMSANNGTLVLSRVVVKKCNGGLDTRGKITVSLCSIHDNTGIGIAFATGGTLDVERSTVEGNAVGIQLAAGTVTVRNTFVVQNASHGVDITGGANTTISFDTIVDNEAGGSDGDMAVACGSAGIGPTIEDTIIAANGLDDDQVGCGTLSYDATTGDPSTGLNNIHVDYDGLFVNPSMGDYHLVANTAPIDKADPAATLTIDFDGQVRPQGPRCDIGADEAQ